MSEYSTLLSNPTWLKWWNIGTYPLKMDVNLTFLFILWEWKINKKYDARQHAKYNEQWELEHWCPICFNIFIQNNTWHWKDMCALENHPPMIRGVNYPLSDSEWCTIKLSNCQIVDYQFDFDQLTKNTNHICWASIWKTYYFDYAK